MLIITHINFNSNLNSESKKQRKKWKLDIYFKINKLNVNLKKILLINKKIKIK